VRWFLVILLIPVGVTGVAAVGASLLGGSEVVPREAVREPRSSPLAILPTLFFATFPSTLEEFGWRGYALGQLQMDQSALGASLLFGVVWAIWHLPLFFITGSFRREFAGVATSGFRLFVVGIVALSGTFTLVYDRTSRSSTNQTEY
jgi:membrane protease YdiL (CAAX protease family)